MYDLEKSATGPARGWWLAGLGAAAGGAIHLIVREARVVPGEAAMAWGVTDDPTRLAMATAIGVAAGAFALTLDRPRARWAAIFSLVAGLVVAAVMLWNGPPGGWTDNDGWRLVSGIFAILVAAPLFQTIRDEGRFALPYARLFDHGWTDAVLGGLALCFLGATWLLAFLLGALFDLISIDVVERLLRQEWFGMTMTGAALGGAIGVLREQERIVASLRNVAVAVLGLLAPVLGAGLGLFLLATPFTGLEPLWEATKATTPILLTCVLGAAVLVNVVIGGSEDEEKRSRPLRWGARLLALAMLPLAAIAAISIGERIGQHGLTPSRLWTLVVVIVSIVAAVAYLAALVPGRPGGWSGRIRAANRHLAIGVGGVALLLATPLAGFGALSARDQVARLTAGKVAPERFDWKALAFDFGPAGRRELLALSRSPNPSIRRLAAATARAEDRWALRENESLLKVEMGLRKRIRVLPTAVAVPDDLRRAVFGMPAVAANGDGGSRGNGLCDALDETSCTLFWQPGRTTAVALKQGCAQMSPEERSRYIYRCGTEYAVYEHVDGLWRNVERPSGGDFSTPGDEQRRAREERAAIERADVEVRRVSRRQLFVGGKPVGNVFE